MEGTRKAALVALADAIRSENARWNTLAKGLLQPDLSAEDKASYREMLEEMRLLLEQRVAELREIADGAPHAIAAKILFESVRASKREADVPERLCEIAAMPVEAEAPSLEPPISILREASRQQQAMIDALWNKPQQRKAEFIAKIWGSDGASDENVKKALSRLNELLLAHQAAVELAGSLIIFTRPTK